MANAAFRDVSFLLRRSHNEQVAKILRDPEASANDKYVALTFLRNAEVSVRGQLPLCQDTGTAIIHGEKGQQVSRTRVFPSCPYDSPISFATDKLGRLPNLSPYTPSSMMR